MTTIARRELLAVSSAHIGPLLLALLAAIC
jgi:hypothetical protein